MDLLAGQEREAEATGAPLFAMTAAALRFLCIKGIKDNVLLPQSIEEAALAVVRLLIATTYKRGQTGGGRDVAKFGNVRLEEVSDQLCLTMHVAVTKCRRGHAGVVEGALGLLNVVMSIDMGEMESKERIQLLSEIKRLVSGKTGERWLQRLNVSGTEVVNLVCQLGSQGGVFMKIEGVRALVVAVSKSIFRKRQVSFLWRQINIIRMMVRLVGIVGDRAFWNLLKSQVIISLEEENREDDEKEEGRGRGRSGKSGKSGKAVHPPPKPAQSVELYPLLGDMVGLLKRKMQERAGLVRREEDNLWCGVESRRIEDRENASSLEELIILEGLKMLEKVEVLGTRVVHQQNTNVVVRRPILGGRLGEETVGLYTMAKGMRMTEHLMRTE